MGGIEVAEAAEPLTVLGRLVALKFLARVGADLRVRPSEGAESRQAGTPLQETAYMLPERARGGRLENPSGL